jgi:hypothetical protein
MSTYKRACGGNEQAAVSLYLDNIRVSKMFYGVLCFFEVALRNAINNHYVHYFNDTDWIFHQSTAKFFMTRQQETIRKEKSKLNSCNSYSPDNLVSSLSFGFWSDMFLSTPFNNGHQTLLKIFINREKGMSQNMVHNELDEIRRFRNHIAHHEPICFDKKGKASWGYCEKIKELILKYSCSLGLPEEFYFSLFDK